MHIPGRGDEALRRHRVSLRRASYFLTLCTADRAFGLTAAPIATALRREIGAIESSRHWRLRAGVLMPDHLHVFIQLTGELSISRCVARLKAKTSSSLSAAHLAWQPNFFEHHMRPNDPMADVVRYLFLNPYRAGLVAASQRYPHFWLGAEEALWFEPTTDTSKPFPEWLR